MTIEKALATPGFMAESELTYLATLAQKHIAIAEVGSWCGRSARAFADNTNGKVWCIDTWADDAYGSAPAEITGKPEWLMEEFAKYHGDTIGTKITRVRTTSVEGARLLMGCTFDVIFIDAGHNYEDVASDIAAWTPLLCPDGVLCGHDYAAYHPGVIRAVDEFVPNRRIVEGTTIWTTEAV